MVGTTADFVAKYMFQRYVYVALPPALRIALLSVGALWDAKRMARPKSRLLFIASSAPIIAVYHDVLLDPGGPLILGAIMGLCYYISPGSAYRWDTENGAHGDADAPTSPGYISLWLAYGIIISRTELSWALVHAALINPPYCWAVYSVPIMGLASVLLQFWGVIRIYGHRAYSAISVAAFLAYRKCAVWHHRLNFSLFIMNDSVFEYENLDEAASEIRLLRLSKTSSLRNMIQLHFVVSPISNAPSFEAVSYRWNPGPKIPILLEGRRFLVYEAVYFMLKGLCEDMEEKMIWIDAISVSTRTIWTRSDGRSFSWEIYMLRVSR